MADRAVVSRSLVAVVVALALTGCVGPTRTETALRKQASMSAESAVSELNTIDLVVRTQLRGDTWWAYTDLMATTSEEALGTVADTFASRQPPVPTADSVYGRVGDALAEAADLAAQVRIAVRRHDSAELRTLRPRLRQAAERLTELENVG